MTKAQSLIFHPNLHSRLVIHQHKSIWFYCQSEQDYIIELWSNLSLDKRWQARSFILFQDEYQLEIDVLLEPGEYEFTFRYKSFFDETWSWYGSPDTNGQISITRSLPPVTQPSLPQQLCLVAKQRTNNINLWHFKNNENNTCIVGRFNRDSFVSCIKKGSCWLTPVTDFNNEQEWKLLMYKENGTTHLMMIIGQDAWLSPGNSDTVHLNHQGDLIIASMSNANDDVSSLIKTVFNYHAHPTSKNTINDSIMLNKLGYCTWNAFGKSVNASKIDTVLASLHKNNIPVAYIIIDDGWQMFNQNQQLTSMYACPNKFPGGLKHVVTTLKSKYPFIKSIGVWHALWGYWNGTEKRFSEKYGYYSSKIQSQQTTIGLVHHPDQFYHDFYSFLNESNIDFVKVDNQGSFQDLDIWNKIDIWDTYRQAVKKQADIFFHDQILHSMALTPHILLNPILSKNSIIRNSDDFFPNENDSHTWHIYVNAINSFWTSNMIGDWDMFQSDHPFGEYHASSRAISGGPIYITDEPDKHNTKLLFRLIGQSRNNGYLILRSEQAPQPTLDTVFGNPMKNKSILELRNFHGEYNVHGFWNTSQYDQLGIVTTDLNQAIAYVVSGKDQGKLKQLTSGGKFSVRVKGLSSSLISISPIHSLGTFSIACLGLIDKFNGTRAISQTAHLDDVNYQVLLTHRGCCGFWLDKEPKSVIVDNHGVDIDWNKETGLLKVDMMSVRLDVTTNDLFCIVIN